MAKGVRLRHGLRRRRDGPPTLPIRHIGFALTYAIAVGLSAVLGTIATPLWEHTLGEKLSKPGGGWVLAGMGVGVLGIAGCGLAGKAEGTRLPRPTRRVGRVLPDQGPAL